MLRIEGLAGSPLVCRVVGHQRVSRRNVVPLPAEAVVVIEEGRGLFHEFVLGRRQGGRGKFSSSAHGRIYLWLSCALQSYGALPAGMYGAVVVVAGRGGAGGGQEWSE
jgi:hypothetical protein